jgi:hypothetical protein
MKQNPREEMARQRKVNTPMTYDTMSVDEWLHTFYLACSGGYTSVNLTVAEITRELRRAVIREATISTVTVTTTEHYDELCRPTDPDRICTMSSTYTYSQWVPEGEYWLCKKEG